MKVVKCLDHISKYFRGMVIEEDDSLLLTLEPSDTFPLPEQGEKAKALAKEKGIEL